MSSIFDFFRSKLVFMEVFYNYLKKKFFFKIFAWEGYTRTQKEFYILAFFKFHGTAC